MSALRDPDQILGAWLDEGPTDLPEPTRRAIEVSTRTTPQRRHALRLPWRFTIMSTTFKLALGAAAVIAVVLGGAFLLGPSAPDSSVGGGNPTPSPSPTASPSPPPTASLSPSPTASLSPSSPAASAPIDTAAWTTYTSSQYGFTIGHPADWTLDSATRAWTWDDAKEVLNPAQENFHSADGHVRVSAWSVATETSMGFAPWADVEAWVVDYCEKSGTGPCAGIHDRAVPLCLELRDCHPGLLVPFDTDVQAFFTGGNFGDNMVVVVVWWGESEPAVASYGGSRRLLEAFLSTMGVFPPAAMYPESRAAADAYKASRP